LKAKNVYAHEDVKKLVTWSNAEKLDRRLIDGILNFKKTRWLPKLSMQFK
jgi:hypothetical protein